MNGAETFFEKLDADRKKAIIDQPDEWDEITFTFKTIYRLKHLDEKYPSIKLDQTTTAIHRIRMKYLDLSSIVDPDLGDLFKIKYTIKEITWGNSLDEPDIRYAPDLEHIRQGCIGVLQRRHDEVICLPDICP